MMRVLLAAAVVLVCDATLPIEFAPRTVFDGAQRTHAETKVGTVITPVPSTQPVSKPKSEFDASTTVANAPSKFTLTTTTGATTTVGTGQSPLMTTTTATANGVAKTGCCGCFCKSICDCLMCAASFWRCILIFIVLVASCCCNWWSCFFCVGWLTDGSARERRRSIVPNFVPMYIPWMMPSYYQQQQPMHVTANAFVMAPNGVPMAGSTATSIPRQEPFYAPAPPTYDEEMGRKRFVV